MSSTKRYTPGLGIEYEVHVPAYFALLLNTNPEVEDFSLRSNVQDFGNLDDLLVDIKTKSGDNLYFAFQLKHKEKSSKNLLPTNFEARGDFNLEKYCEAFKKLNEENKKYHFILYTNKNFDFLRTNEVQKFDMKHDGCCLGRNFFDTSNYGMHLYKFEVNAETEEGKNVNKKDYEKFFSQFSLYTRQANIRNLEKSILDILKYKECYATYIDFFRRWHRDDFTDTILDKKTLNVHLVDILLSSVAIKWHLSDGQDENLIFFEEMVQQFDITIINASKQDFIKELEQNIHKYPEEFNKADLIRVAKDHKLIDRFTKELKEETKLKLLHYLYQKPLILDFGESSKDLIFEASKLCKLQENEIKLVILGQNIDNNLSMFTHLKIFTNLTGINGNFLEETKRRCNLLLQGRNISFEEIFDDKIREFVTPRDIFQMLKGSFSIGEDKEKLPECYIPRTVSATVFDIESITKHSSKSATIIFYYADKFEELQILIQDIVDCEDYFYEDFLDDIILRREEPSDEQLHQDNSRDTFPEIPTIILRREECSRKQFEEICEKLRKEEHSKKDILEETSYSDDASDDSSEESEIKDVHLFHMIDEKRCLLLMSTKNIFCNQNYESTKMYVEEDDIHGFFDKSINILCAQSGMGKSTLMKYLKNEYNPNFWTVMVDLKAHNQFLKRNHKIQDVLNYFLELENCQDIFILKIKKMFLEKQKIVFFLDGLDEVENECIEYVLYITRQLSEMGFRIWLSSRQHLHQKIGNYFNIFVIEIDEINENQQKKYIEERLRSQYNEKEIEEIVKKIFNNTDLASNRRILEIPLQLHIITQIFLDDKSYYSNLRKNNFILTKMLEIFFEGKYKHFLAKFESKNFHLLGGLEEKLENYETVALHSVLGDKHFQKLQIKKKKMIQFKNWDFLGIITEINSENKAVFEHLTFAEYFASNFLVKNFDKARILKEEIFSEKYQNLFLIFNIMLAEDSPLHLAIIYKDLSRIEEMHQSSLVDKGGRNFLQVVTCVATRHPPLETYITPSISECLVKDLSVQYFKGEDLRIKEIVNFVSSEPFKNDKIFEWNSLDYALVNGALYVVEEILEKFKKPLNFYEILGKYYSDEVVAYYSIRFGYHRLLSEILAKKSCNVTGILSDYLWENANNSVFNYLFFKSECTNRTKIVELLTCDNINKTVYEKDGWTFLHFAVFHKDKEIVKFLLEKKADINISDRNDQSPIFLAVKQRNFEISKLLVEKGAKVNTKNSYGKSPLFLAAKQSNFEISKLLVEKGAEVNTKDPCGKSPLLLAAKQSNFEISKLLVEKEAEVNTKNSCGESPLFWAAKQNNFEISKLLVEKGAKVNTKNSYGKSPLFLAAKQSNFEISKLLVEKGAEVNTKDPCGKSPLLLAAKQSNFEISKLLVEKGAEVNTKNSYGESPLFWAAKQSNFEISKLLVEKGAEVNTKDPCGESPLFWAAKRSNFEIWKLLVEKEAEVNTKNSYGESPLFWAAKQSNFDISKLLVEKGAEVNIKNTYLGEPPPFWAAKQSNFEISKFLVEKGTEVNTKDSCGKSPLFWAAKQNNFEISKLLVEKGAEVNTKNSYGESPLFWAAKQSNLEISKLLVEKGAEVNTKNSYGESPLFWAAKQSDFEISKLLVEKGAEVNTKNSYGESPLFWAAKQSNFEISKLLVEKGAEVNTKNSYGESPLFWAAKQSNLEISKLLVEKEAEVNTKNSYGESPLFWAAKQSNFEISKLLVKKGAKVNTKNSYGESPLFWAAKQSNFEILKFLVEKGAKVNTKDSYGESPLFWAAKQSNLEISKLLVEKGAEVNTKNSYGESPLFWAAKQSNFEISKLLVEKGAEVNTKDSCGESPLFWAAKQSNFEILKFLVEKGAEVNTKNSYGESPLFQAVKLRNFEISKLLIEKGADVNILDKEGRSWSNEITLGLSIEYEVRLAAYFALLLNTNQEIEDFRLQSNVEEFGNLDDLLINIKTKSGENLNFAFQLKHKEKSSKDLLPTNFEAKGDFNLEKYCEAFKKLNEENRKRYHFILYTNKNFDSSRTSEVEKMDMKQDKCCLGRNFFDTSGDGKHLYKFEVNAETEEGEKVNKKDYEEFFSKFNLYTGQANASNLEKSILDNLKSKKCYETYIDFFRKWHRGDFTDKILDKKTLNVHLLDIFL